MCRVTDDRLDGDGVTLQWHKDGAMIAVDDDQDRYTFDGPYLNIEKVIGQDAGQYTCTAVRGDEQRQSAPVTINIQRQSHARTHHHHKYFLKWPKHAATPPRGPLQSQSSKQAGSDSVVTATKQICL